MTGAEADDDIPLGERKTVTDFCYLLDKSKQLFNGLRSVRTVPMETCRTWWVDCDRGSTGGKHSVLGPGLGQTAGSGLSLRNNKLSGEWVFWAFSPNPFRNRRFGAFGKQKLCCSQFASAGLTVPQQNCSCCFSWYSEGRKQSDRRSTGRSRRVPAELQNLWADGGFIFHFFWLKSFY